MSVEQPQVPPLTTDQMREVDRALTEDFSINLLQMMENAGRNLAALARKRFLDGDPTGKRVVILAGTGGNGGGALVAARHLSNWGASVQVYLTRPAEDYRRVTAHQLVILYRMKLPITYGRSIAPIGTADLIIDGLIGYNLVGAPKGVTAHLIDWANAQKVPVLSLDTPSGMDPTTGAIFPPAISAAATMTLALPKKGLLVPGISARIGELYLADISVPPMLYGEPGLNIKVGHLFAKEEIIRLR